MLGILRPESEIDQYNSKKRFHLGINWDILARDEKRDYDGGESQEANFYPWQGAFVRIRRRQGESEQRPDVAISVDREEAKHE